MTENRLPLVLEHRLNKNQVMQLHGTAMLERLIRYRVRFSCEGSWEHKPGDLAHSTWVSPMFTEIETWLATHIQRPYYIEGYSPSFTIWFDSGLDLDAFCRRFSLAHETEPKVPLAD